MKKILLSVILIGLGIGACAYPVRSMLSAKESWTEASTPLTAADYVHDGLVALYDGIENVGYGRYGNTCGMQNLVVGGIFGDFRGGFTGDDFFLLTQGASSLISSQIDSSYLTVEACVEYCNPQKTQKRIFAIPSAATASSICAYSWDANRELSLTRSVMWKRLDNVSDAEGRVATTMTIAARLASGQTASQLLFASGIGGRYVFVEKDDNWTASYALLSSGKIYLGDSGFDLKVHSIRVYNRVLDEDEVAFNYEIDVERFGL